MQRSPLTFSRICIIIKSRDRSSVFDFYVQEKGTKMATEMLTPKQPEQGAQGEVRFPGEDPHSWCDVGAYLWGEKGRNPQNKYELGGFGLSVRGSNWICTSCHISVLMWPDPAYTKVVHHPDTVRSSAGSSRFFMATRRTLSTCGVPKGIWEHGCFGSVDEEEKLVFLAIDSGDTGHQMVLWINDYVE